MKIATVSVIALQCLSKRLLVLGSGLWLIVMLAACGFHLRGHYQLPVFMREMVLQSNQPYGEIARDLRRNLQASGVVLLKQQTESPVALLNVTERAVERRILSVDEHGRAREYEITYPVTFSVMYPGHDLVLQKDLVLTRDYLFDPENALAASAEEELLKRNMQREIVQLMMDQLVAAQLQNKQEPVPQ